MIYVLYGASGVGKKSVCKCIVENFGLEVIDKYTTKDAVGAQLKEDIAHNKRFKDDNFLISLPLAVFEKRRGQDYIYDRFKRDGTGTVSYLIKKQDIDRAVSLSKTKDFILVCSNSTTLNEIKQYVGDSDWEQNFRKILVVGATNNSSHWTDRDTQDIYDELKQDPKQFFGVIHNKYCADGYGDEVINRIYRQWTYITGMESTSKKIFFIKPYVLRPVDELTVFSEEQSDEYGPIMDEIASVLDKRDIDYSIESVLLSPRKTRTYLVGNEFSDKREDFIYQEINKIIHNIDPEFTAEIVNNDLNAQGELIVEKIIRQIQSAGLVIVDLSHHRHNCYYELAMARALKRNIIVIIDKDEAVRVPFDEDQRDRFKYEIQYDFDELACNGDGMLIANGIRFCDVIRGRREFSTVVKEFIDKARKMYQIKWL